MDYFQGVVTEFLRANRSTFVNTEYMIDLDSDKKYRKDRHWYCDALCVNFSDRTVYLCEISYSKTLSALTKRLTAWAQHWPDVCTAIRRTSQLDDSWSYRPWAFIPADLADQFSSKLSRITANGTSMPMPRIETLEAVAPWNYCSWDREDRSDA